MDSEEMQQSTQASASCVAIVVSSVNAAEKKRVGTLKSNDH